MSSKLHLVLQQASIIKKRFNKWQLIKNKTVKELKVKFIVEERRQNQIINKCLKHWMRVAGIKELWEKEYLNRTRVQRHFDKWLEFAGFEKIYEYVECSVCNNGWNVFGKGNCGCPYKKLRGYSRIQKLVEIKN